MSGDQFKYVNIIPRFGKKFEFTDIQDFQININSKMLMVGLGDGEFSFLLDNLRYSEVGLAAQAGKLIFQQLEVVLMPLAGEQPEIIHVRDIINYEWKVDNGLLMVFGKTVTMIFHIDQVLSFQSA